jgi:predicted Zn-dependent peptidase
MEYELNTLANGVQVVVAPMASMYSVTVSVTVRVGSRYEQPDQAGAAHLIEHMLFKGTERRPTAESISETIERVGGMLNASTDKELTGFWARVSREHAGLAIDLLSDMMLHSRFEQEEVEKERRVVIEELAMAMDSPQEWVHTVTDQRCWPNSAIGRDVAGSKESVTALTRENLLAFMQAHYLPTRTVVAMAGCISVRDGLALAEASFGPWTAAALTPDAPETASYLPAPPDVYWEERDTEQMNLCLATRGVPRHSDDRYAFELLTAIFGGSMSSRLFLEIRERRGLAYDIHAYGNVVDETAALVSYAAVDPDRAEEVVSEIVRQMRSLRDDLVPEEELSKVRDSYRGRLLLGLEDTPSVAGWCGVQQALHGTIRQPEAVWADVERVSRDDIRRLAEFCFQPEYLRLVALGPRRGGHGLREALAL